MISHVTDKILFVRNMDKKSRRNNLVIFKMPENKVKGVCNRLKEDNDFCLKLMKDILSINFKESDFEKILLMEKIAGGKERHALIELKF